jgi:hypothetical protein
MLKSFASRYSMSRTCGPRDMISLVIPRVGDNRVLDPEEILVWDYLPSLERLFLALLGFFWTHIYLLSEMDKFPEGGRTRGLRYGDLWSIFVDDYSCMRHPPGHRLSDSA